MAVISTFFKHIQKQHNRSHNSTKNLNRNVSQTEKTRTLRHIWCCTKQTDGLNVKKFVFTHRKSKQNHMNYTLATLCFSFVVEFCIILFHTCSLVVLVTHLFLIWECALKNADSDAGSGSDSVQSETFINLSSHFLRCYVFRRKRQTRWSVCRIFCFWSNVLNAKLNAHSHAPLSSRNSNHNHYRI